MDHHQSEDGQISSSEGTYTTNHIYIHVCVCARKLSKAKVVVNLARKALLQEYIYLMAEKAIWLDIALLCCICLLNHQIIALLYTTLILVASRKWTATVHVRFKGRCCVHI